MNHLSIAGESAELFIPGVNRLCAASDAGVDMRAAALALAANPHDIIDVASPLQPELFPRGPP
jgi:hypothetical protein